MKARDILIEWKKEGGVIRSEWVDTYADNVFLAIAQAKNAIKDREGNVLMRVPRGENVRDTKR